MFGLNKKLENDIKELLNMNDFDIQDVELTNDEINEMFKSDNFKMSDVGINNDGLNKLLDEIGKTEIPIERKTPGMIEKNPDPASREAELVEFTWLHTLFVTPLSELAKRVCSRIGLPYSEIPSFSNLSIYGRVTNLRDFLFSKGFTADDLKSLVPQNEKEIEVLAHASKYGFDLGYDGISNLTNNCRVLRAKNYLVSKVIKKPNGVEIENLEGKSK